MHYNGCNYLSMLGLKLNHVSKRGHWSHTSICHDINQFLLYESYLYNDNPYHTKYIPFTLKHAPVGQILLQPVQNFICENIPQNKGRVLPSLMGHITLMTISQTTLLVPLLQIIASHFEYGCRMFESLNIHIILITDAWNQAWFDHQQYNQ